MAWCIILQLCHKANTLGFCNYFHHCLFYIFFLLPVKRNIHRAALDSRGMAWCIILELCPKANTWGTSSVSSFLTAFVDFMIFYSNAIFFLSCYYLDFIYHDWRSLVVLYNSDHQQQLTDCTDLNVANYVPVKFALIFRDIVPGCFVCVCVCVSECVWECVCVCVWVTCAWECVCVCESACRRREYVW